MSIKYKRVMLKISGEALAGSKGFGLDSETVTSIAANIFGLTRLIIIRIFFLSIPSNISAAREASRMEAGSAPVTKMARSANLAANLNPASMPAGASSNM